VKNAGSRVTAKGGGCGVWGGGWKVEGGGWRAEGGGWRVKGGSRGWMEGERYTV
jgi:hypothetical protein